MCHQHEAREPEAMASERAGTSRDQTQDGALAMSGVGVLISKAPCLDGPHSPGGKRTGGSTGYSHCS